MCRLFVRGSWSFLLALIGANVTAQPGSPNDDRIWYKEPSGSTWENALPIGNGRLGAMVYGNVDTERLQLNEATIWSGGPSRNDNPMALDSLATIRREIWQRHYKQAQDLADKAIISQGSQGQMFEPAGEVELIFPGHEKYRNYYRELDISRAIASTSYTVGDVTYTREYLVSLPDGVVVMRLNANRRNSISFTTAFARPEPHVRVHTLHHSQLTFSGTTIGHEGVTGMVQYEGIVQINPEGGTLTSTDTTLTVTSADAVTIFISIATNFNNYHDVSGDAGKRAITWLERAGARSYAAIARRHVTAYQRYFNRVSLDLGKTDAAKLPTDERLRNFPAGNDPQFVALYFQFGRYLLISSSQPGGSRPICKDYGTTSYIRPGIANTPSTSIRR